ncbi:hypothetical protein CH253_17780 [Rhodococcus sp. 06-156-3C]|uniref:hypothetical protein n=1 Tax=Nocardiaceae TaxID=85025 RepID=UPI000522F744|nr:MULTISPECIES: hypothetical protein [Rhodococcus]OZD18313.1 hypothetical protein CH280_07105 [Rhodococcus sp. 06-156-4C]OZD18911.1 hypothetical protein CH253_17780 [Rhodococcus sp. 06-156-3C]OZD22421.1 hypothetical protein CH248_09365 [Rhodococcus sp. 06-156-4a]OZD34005.1 hypothetical protein CH247_07895 [Rhodococcus sp. 06-156-3b]OZD38742.1 hypothetical protein CH284_06315 [Rhodococcus sp. 06-156-3]
MTRFITTLLVRRLIALILVLACISTATACKEEESEIVVDVVCSLTGVVIRIISVATKFTPSAPASIGLDVLAVSATGGCKYLFEQIMSDTSPTTSTAYLVNPPEYIPAGFNLPVNSRVCSNQAGAYATAITGAALGRGEGYGDFPRTDCGFANAVRDSYLAADGPPSSPDGAPRQLTVTAWSPVMKRYYEMYCSGFYPVECRGGDHALVYLT